jgi:hypothetical protein
MTERIPDELQPDAEELNTISGLSVGEGEVRPGQEDASQEGMAPVGLPPAPPVPAPSRDGLSADQVAALVGEGAPADTDPSES